MVASDKTNDNNLIELISSGNHHAFSTLVKKYGEYFYRISYRYVSNKHSAEDIVQQAFLKLWETPYKFNPDKASFKVWFCRIVINLSIDFLRARKPTFDVDDYEIADNSKHSDDEIDTKRQSDILERAIYKLPDRQKTALNLIVYEELSYEEVATIMNLRTGAIKSLIVRAKENLKKYMKENIDV